MFPVNDTQKRIIKPLTMDIGIAILEKVTKMERYLYYDKETNTPGVIERMHELEKQVEDMKQEQSVKRKVWAVFGALGGGFIMIVIELIKWLAANPKH